MLTPKVAWFTPWRAAVVIFLLSFFTRLAIYLLFAGPRPIPSDTELGRIATEIGLHHQFANPYKTPTGATAHAAPLYPLIQCVWIALFGNTLTAGICAALVNIVFSSVASALLPSLALQCGIPVSVGILAGLFQAAFPVSALQELSFFDATLVAMLLVVASLVTIRIFTRSSYSVLSAFGYGMLWGLVLLASPVTMTVFAGFLLVGFYFSFRRLRRSYGIFAGIALLSAFLTVLPWTIRNYFAFGEFFFIRDDFGLEMKISNNSEASPLMDVNLTLPFYLEMHPSDSPEEAQVVREVGEREYNRRALHTAFEWIKGHPAQFLKLSFRRLTIFWFMLGWPPWKGVILVPMVLLAVAGCVRMVSRHPVAGWTIASIPILFPPIYYIVQTSSRYRFPAYWTVSFLAFYALVTHFQPEGSRVAMASGRVTDDTRPAKVP